MLFAFLSAYALVPWEIEEVFFKPYQELGYYDEVRYAGGTWRAEKCRDVFQYGDTCQYVQLKFNGKIVYSDFTELIEEKHRGDYRDAGFLRLPDGEVFFVMRSQSAAGHGQDTDFYRLSARGQVKKIFSDQSESGGPVFRDFDNDGEYEWVFDDFSYYGFEGEFPAWILVYKPDPSGNLVLWKKVPNRHKVWVDCLVVPAWNARGLQKFEYSERLP